MKHIEPIIQFTLATASLGLLTGIILHDTKLDKATVSAMSVPAVASAALSGSLHVDLGRLKGDAHTHVERGSVRMHSSPQLVRRFDTRKYLKSKMPQRAYYDSYQPLA